MRRAILVAGVAVALAGVLASFNTAPGKPTTVKSEEAKYEKFWVYIGTYTGGASKGIHRMEFDTIQAKFTPPELAGKASNPSFLAVHPNHKFLYACNEVDNSDGKKTGAVSAFEIDPKTGDLKELNHQSSEGTGPCHLVVDKAGTHVLVANYGSGSAGVLPIDKDGKLGEPTCKVQHEGRSANPQRQEGPHAHSINLDPANKFAFVADLGLDKVMIYRNDGANGKLTPNDPPSVSLDPGAGPRHFAFHPSGKYAYVINELQSTVTAFNYDAEKGALTPMQTITTLPKQWKGESTCAEVQVHPSGKFLYGSNRGHDSIAIFLIDQETGKLTPAGHQNKKIKTPRNFGIDPTGGFLVVANQDANTLVLFRINPRTGNLDATPTSVDVPSPVCVKMIPRT